MTEYLGKLVDEMTGDEQDAVAFAINHFGTSGHPMANRQGLGFFGKDYAKECLERALKSQVSVRFGLLARSALKKLQ